MAFRDILKISRKTFFNPRGWLGYDTISDQSKTVFLILKNLFAKPVPSEIKESFSEAMTRLNLTEADIEKGTRRYRMIAIMFLCVGLLVFFYAFFLLFQHGAFLGWLLGVATAALFFAQAFKYDFWSFQMRRRQLGATFADWRRNLLGDKDVAK